jgi:hypothetical protein
MVVPARIVEPFSPRTGDDVRFSAELDFDRRSALPVRGTSALEVKEHIVPAPRAVAAHASGCVERAAVRAFSPVGVAALAKGAFSTVQFRVVGVVGANHQIGADVVHAVVVNVMNNGADRQSAPKRPLRDKYVLKDVPILVRALMVRRVNHDVAIAVCISAAPARNPPASSSEAQAIVLRLAFDQPALCAALERESCLIATPAPA